MVIIGNGLAGVWALAAERYESLRTRALWWFTVFVEFAIFVQVALGVGLVSGQPYLRPGGALQRLEPGRAAPRRGQEESRRLADALETPAGGEGAGAFQEISRLLRRRGGLSGSRQGPRRLQGARTIAEEEGTR